MGRTSRRLVGAGLLVIFTGCADLKYTMEYSSRVRHEPLPLRTTVTVLVSPELRKEMDDDPARLEGLRQMYQRSLRRDLNDNGPMKPVVDRPEARLLVTLNKVDLKQLELAAMTWFLAPFWLVGLPYQWARVELSADVVLTSAWGEVLYRAQHTARCTRTTGLYYGRRDLTFGCPGQKIAEAVRERVSLGRADVLARVERGRPRERSRPSKPSPVPVPVATTAILPMPTAAVFNIRDMSGQFNERVIDQLTEYLSARVAAELSYKVVPREEIRSQLADSKQESFRPCYEESCQIEVGKALAASKSVSTTLLRIGNQCAFTSTVFDLKTEAADRAASIKTPCDEDALLDGVDRVVQQLEARVSR